MPTASRRSPNPPVPGRAARLGGLLIALAAAAGIARLTLTPQPVMALVRIPHDCVICGPIGMADLLANVVLFLPLGAGLRLAGLSWRAAVLAGGAFSVGIELAQAFVIAGRFATVSDVVTNTLGTCFGALAMGARHTLLRPRPPAAARLAAAGGAAWLGALTLGGWAMSRPIDLDAPPPRLAPRPHAPGFGWFEGTVDAATFGALAVRHRGTGPVVVQGAVGREAAGSVVARGRDHRNDLIPLLFVHSVADTVPRLVLGQRGSDAELVLGTRGTSAWLRPPSVRVTGALAPGAGAAPFTLRGAVRGDSLRLEFARGARRGTSTLRVAPTLGWALLSPIPRVDSAAARLATAAWLLGLAAPLGYWSRLALGSGRRRGAITAALALTTVAIGLGIVPRLWGFGAATVGEWGAGLGGAALGALAAAIPRRRA